MTAATDSQPEDSSFMQRLTDKLAMSRFFTVSLLIHVILLILIGGTVIYKSTAKPTDFEAGDGGSLVSDLPEAAPPPQDPQDQPNQVFTPAAPTVNAPPMTAITTSGSSTFAIAALPMADASIKGLSDNAESAMAAMSDKVGKAAAAAAGRAGGTMKSAMVFGKKVEATKLGVILDVSGSGHKHLATAIKEIEKSFPDALIILYPGCGMMDTKGKRPHTIRKFSSLTKKDLPPDAPNFSTPGQLVKALKIDEFEKLTKRPNLQDRLFVSWFEGDDKGGGNLTGHATVAFEDLMKNGADSIYWFADFEDAVSPEASQDLLKELKRKKVKVYLHNFATDKMPPAVTMLAEGTGGTVSTATPGK